MCTHLNRLSEATLLTEAILLRTYNIPSCYRKSDILIMPSDLALFSTLIGSNYPCLELIFMVPKMFEPLKFDSDACFKKLEKGRGQ